MLKTKHMNEKRFVDHDTSVEDCVESLENNTKEKTKPDVKLLETFEKLKEPRARSAKQRSQN